MRCLLGHELAAWRRGAGQPQPNGAMGTTGGPKTGLSREAEARGRIKALSRQQLWRQVAELLNGRQLDGFAFGAAIHAAAAATAWHAAVHFLEGMASAGIDARIKTGVR